DGGFLGHSGFAQASHNGHSFERGPFREAAGQRDSPIKRQARLVGVTAGFLYLATDVELPVGNHADRYPGLNQIAILELVGNQLLDLVGGFAPRLYLTDKGIREGARIVEPDLIETQVGLAVDADAHHVAGSQSILRVAIRKARLCWHQGQEDKKDSADHGHGCGSARGGSKAASNTDSV